MRVVVVVVGNPANMINNRGLIRKWNNAIRMGMGVLLVGGQGVLWNRGGRPPGHSVHKLLDVNPHLAD